MVSADFCPGVCTTLLMTRSVAEDGDAKATFEQPDLMCVCAVCRGRLWHRHGDAERIHRNPVRSVQVGPSASPPPAETLSGDGVSSGVSGSFQRLRERRGSNAGSFQGQEVDRGPRRVRQSQVSRSSPLTSLRLLSRERDVVPSVCSGPAAHIHLSGSYSNVWTVISATTARRWNSK